MRNDKKRSYLKWGAWLILCFWSSTVWAANPLPEPLKFMMLKNSEIEEAYRDDRWDDASKELNSMSAEYATVLPTLLKAAGSAENRNKIRQFGFLLKDYEKQLKAKDRSKALDSQKLFQGLVVEFVDWFDYQKHPAMEAFAEELDEYKEELDYEDIEDEVEEMNSMVKLIENSLINKGVSKETVNQFFESLEALEIAADAKNADQTLEQLQILEMLTQKMNSK